MKAIIVKTYEDYPEYSIPYNGMIARMLHLTYTMRKLAKEHTVEYKIENRSVYDILHQIYKVIDCYPYVKQKKSKKDGREVFYAINSRWLS